MTTDLHLESLDMDLDPCTAVDTPEPPDGTPTSPAASDGAATGGIPSTTSSDRRRSRHLLSMRTVAFVVLPAMALLMAVSAGYFQWRDTSARAADTARADSVAAARDSTIALLSYRPDTVQQQLGNARDRLTGQFQQSYTSLVNDVVIPGAKQKQITAQARVPAAASVSATDRHAVVLVDVDQTVTVGTDAPADTTSSVRVTLEKVGGRWLISAFDPI